VKRWIWLFCFGSTVLLAQEEGLLNLSAGDWKLSAGAETGFVWVQSHTIKFGKQADTLDYVAQGGQDTLFPFSRFSLDVAWKKNVFVFLYQPLTFETRTLLREDLRIDDTTFVSNTPMRFLYRFPFYRLSWLYTAVRTPGIAGQFGLSLQVRNAEIVFESEDGTLLKRNHNIGPVPILKTRWKFRLNDSLWLGVEADGFYATSSIFNGADFPFTGAIWDASVRLGFAPRKGADFFLNLRVLGGGAEGTSRYKDDELKDGYTRNWLNTLSLTAGAYLW
jgi:hypothetical protein